MHPFGFAWCSFEIILPMSVVKVTKTRLLKLNEIIELINE
jgi:hypothetical protein